jgi:exodeoxyribonuclease V
MEMSKDQRRAIEGLMSWYGDAGKKQFITLGGYAGTGKTTLISVLRQMLDGDNKKLRVGFASFTGKAARVLKNKLMESKAIHPQDSVGTIHSLIYSPIIDKKQNIIGWKRKEEVEADLIVIDEASMVDYEIWKDLLAYHKPIIAVGDHGQLPPINGNFNLMERPELKLDEIHRQAEGNPIIEVSILAREEGKIPVGRWGGGVVKYDKNESFSGEVIEEVLRSYNRNMLVLCGYNYTRVKLNNFIRKTKDFETNDPEIGDRVVCLRNNHKTGIYNGMLGMIEEISKRNDDWWEGRVKMDDEEKIFEGLMSAKQFNNRESLNFTEKRALIMKGDLFDFGYALTVHKAQGSQAKKVVLFEERFGKMDEGMWRRWLYTAVTRAEEELYIVG